MEDAFDNVEDVQAEDQVQAAVPSQDSTKSSAEFEQVSDGEEKELTPLEPEAGIAKG